MSETRIDATVSSGQLFLWQRHGGFWYGIDGQNVLKCDSGGMVGSYKRRRNGFFRTDTELDMMGRSISRDGMVRAAMGRYPGLQLPRQDPFQCMLTFIASSNASIQKIRSNLYSLCRRFGRRIIYDGMAFFLFPEPQRLAGAHIGSIQKCGLGYRSDYIREASRMVSGGTVRFSDISRMRYHDARQRLLAVPGVGNKVADCVLLFSLGMTEAFPLDRWMLRILERHYPELGITARHTTDRQYRAFHDMLVEKFGPHAGYAQQFLFKMERDTQDKKW